MHSGRLFSTCTLPFALPPTACYCRCLLPAVLCARKHCAGTQLISPPERRVCLPALELCAADCNNSLPRGAHCFAPLLDCLPRSFRGSHLGVALGCRAFAHYLSFWIWILVTLRYLATLTSTCLLRAAVHHLTFLTACYRSYLLPPDSHTSLPYTPCRRIAFALRYHWTRAGSRALPLQLPRPFPLPTPTTSGPTPTHTYPHPTAPHYTSPSFHAPQLPRTSRPPPHHNPFTTPTTPHLPTCRP